jgi:hypothetical protein
LAVKLVGKGGPALRGSGVVLVVGEVVVALGLSRFGGGPGAEEVEGVALGEPGSAT